MRIFFYLHAMADSFSKHKDQERLPLSGYEKAISQMNDIQLPVLLSGQEIMQITGLKPGPRIGDIMREIRGKQYNNFGRKENLTFEQSKSLAVEIARKHRKNILNGLEIQEIVARVIGRPISAQPPKGLEGYISVLQRKLQEEQDRNPALTKNDAVQVIERSIQDGLLGGYL